MLRALLPLSVCLAISVLVFAQDSNPHNGTWRASFETKKGTGREGKVVISGQTGTWDLAIAGNNPCFGREFPITVTKATPEELAFDIIRSKALAGCRDGAAKFRRVDEKTLQGEFDGNRKITLTRE